MELLDDTRYQTMIAAQILEPKDAIAPDAEDKFLCSSFINSSIDSLWSR